MRICLSYLAVVIFVVGCSYFEDPGSELILNVDNEFEIGITETLLPQDREINFVITSLDDIHCQESELVLKTESISTLLSIGIKDIMLPTECTDQTSFPSGQASFKVRNLLYDVAIQVKDLDSQMGWLQVTDNNYTLNFDEAKGLIIDRAQLQRVPDNFVWGYYQAIDEETTDKVKTFLQNSNLNARPLTYLEEGFYTYFSIDQTGNIKIDDLPYSNGVNKFAFDNVNLSNVKEKVTLFKNEHPDIKLTMYFSDGTIL